MLKLGQPKPDFPLSCSALFLLSKVDEQIQYRLKMFAKYD